MLILFLNQNQNYVSKESESEVMSYSLRPHGLQPTRIPIPSDFPGKNTAMGSQFLLQGIFPTQGSNPGLPHCRQMLYHLSHIRPNLWITFPPKTHFEYTQEQEPLAAGILSFSEKIHFSLFCVCTLEMVSLHLSLWLTGAEKMKLMVPLYLFSRGAVVSSS